MLRTLLLIAAISFSFISAADANNTCKNKSCSFDNVKIGYCANLESTQANVDCRRKGSDVTCKASMADGTTYKEVLQSDYFRKGCGFTGDGTGTGQCSPYVAKRENAEIMAGLYKSFLGNLSSKLSETKGCVAANQCELFLKRDPELKRFARELSNDGRIDADEFRAIQAESSKLVSGLTAAALNGMDDSSKIPYGPYIKIRSSELDVKGEDKITFVKSIVKDYTTGIDDSDRRTFVIKRRQTEFGRSITISDSSPKSEVELRFVGDQCFPFKASGGTRTAFNFENEAESKQNAYFKAYRAYSTGKSAVTKTASVNKAD